MPATAGKLSNGQAFKPGKQESRKGIAEIQGKATRVGASEWSHWAARDIDGKTERSHGAFWKSDIEGKAAMGSGE
jgi:hypothetical protein